MISRLNHYIYEAHPMRILHAIFYVVFAFILLSSESSAQLTRQWVARFNSGVKKSNSAASAMTVDKLGNIYVTGWVTRNGTGADYATIKYTSDGEQKWVKYYSNTGLSVDKATAIAVDTALNVYVTGTSAAPGGTDYLTVKYDSSAGTLLPVWEARYNGSGSGNDYPVSIAVNDSFNVFVTGWSFGSSTGIDYATLKYDGTGTLKWERRYNGPAMGLANGSDSALAMSLQGSTALYVTGTSRDTTYDYATIKYNAATGDSLWMTRYKGAGNDIARAIVIRSSTEVYVTGSSEGTGTGYDYLTFRYNQSNGGLVWVARYDDPSNGDDHATSISTQSSRVFVSGRALGIGSFNDIVTVRYNQSNGAENWVSTYNGPANDDDGGVAVIGGGTTSVLGMSRGTGVGQDYVLLKIDGSGNVDEAVRYNGIGNTDDIPAAIVSSGGATYVTGMSKPGDKGADFVTIKYVDRDKIKYRTFTQDSLRAIAANLKPASAIPNAGNVREEAFLKAYPKIKKGFPGFPGGLTLGNARYDSAASYGWMRFDKGKALIPFFTQTGLAYGYDLYDGKPHLGEKKNPKLPKIDNHLVGELAALRINIGASDAEITPPTLGDLTYDDGDTSNHYNGMTLRSLASLVDNYLTYWKKYPPVNWALFDSMLSRTNRAFAGTEIAVPWVSKVSFAVTGIRPVDSVAFLQAVMVPMANPLSFPAGSLDNEPRSFTLSQNYPNPFNPTTTIEFELFEPSFVTLKVYDVLGREVATLIDDVELGEGNHDVEFDASTLASGVYLYRITAADGRFQQLKKMMLIR